MENSAEYNVGKVAGQVKAEDFCFEIIREFKANYTKIIDEELDILIVTSNCKTTLHCGKSVWKLYTELEIYGGGQSYSKLLDLIIDLYRNLEPFYEFKVSVIDSGIPFTVCDFENKLASYVLSSTPHCVSKEDLEKAEKCIDEFMCDKFQFITCDNCRNLLAIVNHDSIEDIRSIRCHKCGTTSKY